MSKINFLSQFRDEKTKKLRNFTATQFAEVWNHYDSDGNGYIEGKELDSFLREFISSVVCKGTGPEVISEAALEGMKKDFMAAFDENEDNKIDIAELAHILPTDENFLLIFRRKNPLESTVDFMKVWKAFDKDKSGYIESDELKAFLVHMLNETKPDVKLPPATLDEYTKTILQLFDQNGDGKLQLSEMSRLLPVKENYLSKPIFKNAGQITSQDIDRVFKVYDRDNNGSIEDEELEAFLKDLLALVQEQYDAKDLEFFKKVILDQWDVNHDGKISHDELKMILIQQSRVAQTEQALQSA
jgi:Ca2+-binding EF-hand superfamily protein